MLSSIFLVSFLLIETTLGTGIVNVVFHPINTLYGDSTNQKVTIRGMYNNTIWSALTATEQTATTSSLGNLSDRLLFASLFSDKVYACAVNVPSLIVELSTSDVADIFHDNIASFKAGNKTTKDILDYNTMSCTKVFAATPSTLDELNFVYDHVFAYHHPVLFIDPFGYNSFNYMMKETDDQNEDESTPLRFCEGNEYNGEMYSLGKRPVCPDIHDRDSGIHTKGRITMFKENIVSIVHNVYWCTKTKTHLSSGKRFFGSTWDNRPLVGVHQVPSEDECWEWVNTRSSSWMGTLKKVSDGSYATDNDKSFEYPWCGSKSKDVFDAYMIESKLTVAMPSLEIVTPFGKIPTNMLYDKTFVIGNKGRLVWKPFVHSDICTHVPYASSDGESIQYEHKQHNNKRSRTPSVQHTTYFISNSLKLFEAVDSSKEVASSTKYNCITRPFNSKLYTTSGNTLLRFEDVSVPPFTLRYPHASFKHMHVSEDKSVVTASLTNSHSTKVSNHGSSGVQQTSSPIDTWTIQATGINTTMSYKDPRINYDPSKEKLLFLNASQKAATASTGAALPNEVEDYNNYMNEQAEKKNAAKLSHEMCVQSQREYDLMSRSLAVNPTRLIVQKTRKPIEAKYAGTNFYSIRSCSDITVVKIVPTLYTNSSVAVTVNGVLTRVNDLVSNLSVTPSNLTCLAGALIVFKVGPEESSAQSPELVGQVDAEGIVHTDRAQLLEPCSRNSMGSNHKIFSFRKKSYVFTNYIQEYEVSHELFYEKLHTLHQKAQDTLKAKGNSTPPYAALEEIINKINFLDVEPPPVLDGFQFTPTTLVSQRLYTVAEMLSLPISLSQVIMQRAYDTYFDQVVENRVVSDYTKDDDTNSTNTDADNLISMVGNGISTVVKGGATAVSTLIHAGSSAIHSVVGDGTSVFKSVGHTLSGTLSSIVVPIAVIGGLFLVGSIIVYVLYRKYLMGSGGGGGSSSRKSKSKRKKKQRKDSLSSSDSSTESTDSGRDDGSNEKGQI